MVRTHPGYLSWVVLLLVVLAGRKQWKLITLGLAFVFWLSTGCTSSSSWSRCPVYRSNLDDVAGASWHWPDQSSRTSNDSVALLPFVAVAATRVAQLQIAHQPFLLLLLGCELCLLSPMGIFLPSTSSHHSSLLQAHQPTAGRWLHLPMSGPGHSFQLPLWLQHQHQQPLWLWPNRPGYPPTAPKNETIKWLLHPNASKLPTDLCLPKTVEGIFAEAKLEPIYSSVLGPPQREDQRWLIWDTLEHCGP